MVDNSKVSTKWHQISQQTWRWRTSWCPR